jgi:AraC-like DNA-binding protein
MVFMLMILRLARTGVLNFCDMQAAAASRCATIAIMSTVAATTEQANTAPAVAGQPIARLAAPRLSLASCIRAHVVRSTLGCTPRPEAQRVNRYPASPFCTLFFQLAGDSAMLAPAVPDQPLRAGEALLCGPQSVPTATANGGPVHFLMVLFYPDALHRLTGIDMTECVDTMRPMHEVLDESWQAMAREVFAAPSDDARIAALEQFLEPRWRAVRGGAFDGVLGDWVRRLGAQAAAAGVGRSVRMAERRVREWAGQPLRTLRRMRRAEAAFIDAREQALRGEVLLSDIAARSGFSDQSHMSREARQISGLSPAEILRAGLEDESYWMYRIWN